MSEEEVKVLIDSGEVEQQALPPRDDGKCQYCGGETDMAYGLAGGGIGAYAYCTACGRITDKWQEDAE